MTMKNEYDFSKGERGKFYQPKARLNLPVYLDNDIAVLVQAAAERKQVDVQTVVNQFLRSNQDLLPALQVTAQ
jgi:hypothetical protein